VVKISAYIPCFNNADTILRALDGIERQTHPVAELIVVDDGSTDETPRLLTQKANLRYERSEVNRGRGNARQTAMERSQYDLVLCCDATNRLHPEFLEHALPWFENPRIAAVYGDLADESPGNACDRWRQRHLFRRSETQTPMTTDSLITWGTVLRKSASEAVGGFRRDMPHSEDADLGHRLLSSDWIMMRDPKLRLHPLVSNSPGKLCERFLRWYLGPEPNLSSKTRVKMSVYILKVLASEDFKLREWSALLISIRCSLACLFHQPK